MLCPCGGHIEVIFTENLSYAKCEQCERPYTWKEYRALQAEKIVEMVIKEETPLPVVKDLGWANGWSETPGMVKKCHQAKHKTSDIDVGPQNRGIHHIVRCDICGYVYHYDSSD